VIKTWTTPGPFRWEGEHILRVVNPFETPLQKTPPTDLDSGHRQSGTLEWCADITTPLFFSKRIQSLTCGH